MPTRPADSRFVAFALLALVLAFSAASFAELRKRMSPGRERALHSKGAVRKHGNSPAKVRGVNGPLHAQGARPIGNAHASVAILSGALGRSSLVLNCANQILFTKTFPGTACNPQLTGSPPTFRPTDFDNCDPMQLIRREPGGAETVIATEGQDLGGGLRLAGWGEFYDMNDTGVAAFKAAISGAPVGGQGGEEDEGLGIFLGSGGPLTRIAQSGDVVGGRRICGFGPMVSINEAGQVALEGYSADAFGRCSETSPGSIGIRPSSDWSF